MKTVTDTLEERISAAMAEVAGQKAPAIVRPATDAKFGDYQVNGVMALAKQIKTNPRKLAEQIVAELDLNDICKEPEIAGPGFINLRLKPDFVAANLLQINKGADRLGIEKADKPETIVVDFSGPNIAKQMHVGHLRSTIIGDCICRLLEFEGHKVIRQNHIGDWGLPMGMVVYALEDADWKEEHSNLNLEVLENYYKKITELEKRDSEVADKIRKRTAELHTGNLVAKATWRRACGITLNECYSLYDELGVMLGAEDTRGESFYAVVLPDIVKSLQDNERLKKSNSVRESSGAICVFPPKFKNKEGQPLPLIIQKSDGAYLRACTGWKPVPRLAENGIGSRHVWKCIRRRRQAIKNTFG